MIKTLATLATVAAVGSANAILVIDQEPGNLPGTENILFNDKALLRMGPTVQGMTNETLLLVDFYGAGEDLVAGRARVMGVDGAIDQFSVKMNDPALGIAAYEFNLDALREGKVTIDLYDLGALVHSETFMLNEQGPNWFRIYGTENEAISNVSVSSAVDIAGIRNNRILGVPNPVPEPSGILALGLGLLSLAALRKRS